MRQKGDLPSRLHSGCFHSRSDSPAESSWCTERKGLQSLQMPLAPSVTNTQIRRVLHQPSEAIWQSPLCVQDRPESPEIGSDLPQVPPPQNPGLLAASTDLSSGYNTVSETQGTWEATTHERPEAEQPAHSLAAGVNPRICLVSLLSPLEWWHC